jgi:hypothetical protein
MTLHEMDGQKISKGAADRFGNELLVFSAGAEPPTLQHLLDSLAARLSEEGGDMISDPENLPVTLLARLAPSGAELVSGPPESGDLSEYLAGTLFRMCDEYEAAIGRWPTLAEMLASILACLEAHPAAYVRGVDGQHLVSLQPRKG